MFNTRLKQELAALREELSSLNQVKESLESEMLCLTLDAEGRVEWANANFLQELAYQNGQLLGRAIEDLEPAHVRRDEFQQRFKNALVRGEHFAGTVRLMRGNVQEAWLRSIVQPVRSSDGRIKHFSIYSSDLTRTIEASREHENLMNALVRSTAVIEFDLGGHVLTANDRFLGGMGYWRYGIERLVQLAERGVTLILVPGDDRPDPELSGLSTVAAEQGERLWHFLRQGGRHNALQLYRCIASQWLGRAYTYDEPRTLPRTAIYHPTHSSPALSDWQHLAHSDSPHTEHYRRNLRYAGQNFWLAPLNTAPSRAGFPATVPA